jgi:hypothetical protein
MSVARASARDLPRSNDLWDFDGTLEESQGSVKVHLTKGDSGFAETARGMSCFGLPKMPGQPPRASRVYPCWRFGLSGSRAWDIKGEALGLEFGHSLEVRNQLECELSLLKRPRKRFAAKATLHRNETFVCDDALKRARDSSLGQSEAAPQETGPKAIRAPGRGAGTSSLGPFRCPFRAGRIWES